MTTTWMVVECCSDLFQLFPWKQFYKVTMKLQSLADFISIVLIIHHFNHSAPLGVSHLVRGSRMAWCDHNFLGSCISLTLHVLVLTDKTSTLSVGWLSPFSFFSSYLVPPLTKQITLVHNQCTVVIASVMFIPTHTCVD